MVRYIIVSISAGILFGAMDAVINANPLAQRLYESFRPITKASVNIPAGMLIDLVYGFALAGIFLLLYKSLPGVTGLSKGISFAILVWFLRVLMSVASQWVTYNVSGAALLYTLATGLVEMLVLGILFGLALKSAS